MTPEWCAGKCKLAGYSYAGLQYGYLCFCGDKFGKYGRDDDGDCNSLCFGDKTRNCGSFWHNSIFAVGKGAVAKVTTKSVIQNIYLNQAICKLVILFELIIDLILLCPTQYVLFSATTLFFVLINFQSHNVLCKVRVIR